jgi:hypothetical protein
MCIGNFLFLHYRNVFKDAIVPQQLIAPRLEGLILGKSHSNGGNKLLLKILYSNFVLFVCRLWRAPWQTRTVTRWRGYVQARDESGAVSR